MEFLYGLTTGLRNRYPMVKILCSYVLEFRKNFDIFRMQIAWIYNGIQPWNNLSKRLISNWISEQFFRVSKLCNELKKGWRYTEVVV